MSSLGAIPAKIVGRLRNARQMSGFAMDRLRGLRSLGFVIPPYDGMQNFRRMKFLNDSVRRFAPRVSGVALEIGCYNAGSAVFLGKACLRSGIRRIYAMDLFTGTPSWKQTIDTYATAAARLAAYDLAANVTLI